MPFLVFYYKLNIQVCLFTSQYMQQDVKLYRFGLDYLRVNLSSDTDYPLLDSFFHGLSSNSKEKKQVSFFGKEYDVVLLEFAAKKVLMFSYFGDTVYELVRVFDSGICRTISYTFTFYSTYFYIDDISSVITEFLVKYQNQIQLSRVDIALDVNVTVNELYENHITNTRKSIVRRDADVVETFYVGAKQNNKKHFIRVYDKKLDSKKKNKFHLFLGYLMEKTVSRVELELHVESLKSFGLRGFSVLDSKELWRVFDTCCRNPKTTLFKPLCNVRSTSDFIIPKGVVKSDEVLNSLAYARVMLGYAQRLHGFGFDVIGYLERHLIKNV